MERTAIVTGGTGGLGVAVVSKLRADGWRVVVPWVAERELERLPEDGGIAPIQADLFEAQAVAEVVELAGAEPQTPLRGVANLVGGFAMGGRVHETPIEEFESQFRLNLRPTYLVTAAAIKAMLRSGEGGAIACVSTRAALKPFAGAAGYIASKRALLALVETLAAEYRDDGIRANAVLPSVIDTPANRASQPDADHESWVAPEEIATVIAFLLSDAAAPTSGAAIPVYGRA